MTFRPTPTSRLRAHWARHQPNMRTVQRAAVVTCLGLGAIGGINTITSGCAPAVSVSADQMNATINRAAAVDGFADAYVTAVLTGADPQTLAAYTSTHVDPTPVPVDVIKTHVWSHQRTPSGFGNVDYWSVVIGALVKPPGRAPQIRYHQVPIVVIDGSPRAVSAPAVIGGPPAGFDAELGYPEQLAAGNDLYDTVSGFLAAWLTGGGRDLQRYSASRDIRPFTPAPFSRVTVTAIAADIAIPAAPADGFTAGIMVNGIGQDSSTATTPLAYPLTVEFRGGKWFVTDVELAPRLGARITPVTPTSTPDQPPAWSPTR